MKICVLSGALNNPQTLLLLEFGRHAKHSKIQIPELRSNLSEPRRSLTDAISIKGQTQAYKRRQLIWQQAHSKWIVVACATTLNCLKWFFARQFFKEKKSRYCHHSGVVVGGGVVIVIVVTNFNLGYNFLSVEANLMKLHLLVRHHKGYNLTKNHNSARLFDKIMPLYRHAKMDCVLITGVSIVCDKL